MKSLALIVAAATLGFTGCKTQVEVDRVAPDTYVLREFDRNGFGRSGNAEQGITQTCKGRYIRAIRELGSGGRQRIIVYCGPWLPRER